MIPPVQPLPRDAHEWSDGPEFAGKPVFRSRRMAGSDGAKPGSKALDPVAWMQGFRWGVVSACCGAFVVALIAGALA